MSEFSQKITLENGEVTEVFFKSPFELKARVYEQAGFANPDIQPFVLAKAAVNSPEDYDILLDNLNTAEFLRVVGDWQRSATEAKTAEIEKAKESN